MADDQGERENVGGEKGIPEREISECKGLEAEGMR